ncbi:MAG TPA: hypothetical protein VFE58_08985 [Tepidisphaeraceae bacterium]|jgi:hypothetical protein|nr:hypothetical protein [Tepidisphaeraceae bacterium]
MATQATTNNLSKSNNGNTDTTTNKVRDVGLTGSDFLQVIALEAALQQNVGKQAAENVQDVIGLAQSTFTQTLAANQLNAQTVLRSVNPSDPRQYIPFIVIAGVGIFGGIGVWRWRRR